MHKRSVILLAVLILALGVPGVAGAPPAQAPSGVDTTTQPAAPSASWQTIMTEGFEGTFPGSGWSVPNTSNGYKWAADDFKPYSGAKSAWPAANALDPQFNPYPNNMNTRMYYGPFDLSDAVDAKVTFWLWLWTEDLFNADYFWYGVSRDGVTYNEEGIWEGNLSDWAQMIIDLVPYRGDDSVWLRWDFYSDLDVGIMNGGAYVDDITITKLPLDSPTVSISRSGSNIVLSWPDVASATKYEVWWGTNAPYFTPGTTCPSTNCTVVNSPLPTPPFTHTGAGGSTATNYTYLVRAISGPVKSIPSKRLGEFDFDLIRGGS